MRSGNHIVPREGIAGQALAVVIGIMAFLACLAAGALAIVNDTSSRWQSDISREVTIQIRPSDEAGMEDAIREAGRLVLKFDGIARVTALDDAATARLLEPWLGSGLDLSELPVPRLLTVTVKDGANPDFAEIRRALVDKVPGASLDDHRAWVDRLTRMAWTMVAFGMGILILVMTAMVLTVIFATRGAMAGNREIVDVLHFVGADAAFIAGEFQRHILVLALRGAVVGGFAAALIFVGLGLWSSWSLATPQGDQIAALFGEFSLGWVGYLGIASIIVSVSLLAAATSRFTVLRHVGSLETYSGRD
ncbi:MAG: ABC transporter permease [Nitratireductor sp.]|nr:ABC transporter permease [Nitratireductor sp.]